MPESPAKPTESKKETPKSPLTKLFGGGKAASPASDVTATRSEVDDLRAQLKEMRDSQSRIEALLQSALKSKAK
jgi:hypothetical protein